MLGQGGWDGISLLQAGLLADDCSVWDKPLFFFACGLLHSLEKAWSSAVLLEGVC